jgi:hypothetical protein
MRKILIAVAALAALIGTAGCFHPVDPVTCPMCENELRSCLNRKGCTSHQSCIDICYETANTCREYC